jgi:hypothetical protein
MAMILPSKPCEAALWNQDSSTAAVIARWNLYLPGIH